MEKIKIIENPELKSRLRNITELGVTSIMWTVLTYLILPVANIILWILGIRVFSIEVIEKAGYIHFINLVYNMGWVVFIVFLTLWFWGYYNLKRYGKMQRRKKILPKEDENMFEALGIQEELYRSMRKEKEVFFNWQIDSYKD